jgi:hypothetical protein
MTTYHVRAGDTIIVDPEPAPVPAPAPAPHLRRRARRCRASIANATGTVDTQLRDWLMSLPDGATALLGSAELRLASQLKLEGISNITVEAQTSTIRCVNRTSVEIVLISYGANHVTWRGGSIIGSNPYPGRRQAETYEHNHAFGIRGAQDVEISGVRIRNVGGDFFYLAGGYMPGGSVPPRRADQGPRQRLPGQRPDGRRDARRPRRLRDREQRHGRHHLVQPRRREQRPRLRGRPGRRDGLARSTTTASARCPTAADRPLRRWPGSAPSRPASPSRSPEPRSGTVVIPVDNIEVAFNQTTDPAWPDFRYGIYTPSATTTRINVHDNVRQVRV